MVLAAVLFIRRMAESTEVTEVNQTTETEGSQHSLHGKDVPNGVLVFRVFGAFFFGAAGKLEIAISRTKQDPDVLILRLRKVLAMDATGLNALEELYDKLQKKDRRLILSGPRTQPLFVMEKAGFLDRIGRENVCANIDVSLQRAREILAQKAAVKSHLTTSTLTALSHATHRD
jgi:SulP family sulfate permease